MNLTHKCIDINKIIELVHSTDQIIFDEEAISNIKLKGAADYVTQVDTRVQAYMKQFLNTEYPEIGFMAEEQARFKADSKQSYWILDPIDGTTNLIHHYCQSAVSLALYENGYITFGIVYNPFIKETFVASRGQGAFLNEKQIHVSGIQALPDALIAYGSRPYEKQEAHRLFVLFEKLFLSCADFRRSGSAALDLCHVASGRVDCYVEPNLKPWDYAAGALILEEAGGTICRWNGEDVPYLDNSDICALNPGIKKEILSMLAEY